MSRYLSCLTKAILAGIAIGIGALAFLSIENKIIGSIFFSVGLFIILNFNLNLYTGKICYVVENKNYIQMPIILISNFIGTLLIAQLTRLTKLILFAEKAYAICQLKLNDNLLSLFILGIFCNIMIYLAVYGYNYFKNDISKIIALLFGVSIFIICGFEHCIADMFYFTFANIWSINAFITISIIVLGNTIGGILARLLLKGTI